MCFFFRMFVAVQDFMWKKYWNWTHHTEMKVRQEEHALRRGQKESLHRKYKKHFSWIVPPLIRSVIRFIAGVGVATYLPGDHMCLSCVMGNLSFPKMKLSTHFILINVFYPGSGKKKTLTFDLSSSKEKPLCCPVTIFIFPWLYHREIGEVLYTLRTSNVRLTAQFTYTSL